MSVEQRVRISCDNFECTATISSGVGLTTARTITSEAGWVGTVHYVGPKRTAVYQDFCPDHREQAFDWQTWRERERERLAASSSGSTDPGER
jgi:hypothetical protein